MATTTHTVTSSWALIGSGPLYVENVGVKTVHLHFGASAPAGTSELFIGMGAGDRRDYGGTDNVYARSVSGSTVRVVT
jgi:hypothetical protein